MSNINEQVVEELTKELKSTKLEPESTAPGDGDPAADAPDENSAADSSCEPDFYDASSTHDSSSDHNSGEEDGGEEPELTEAEVEESKRHALELKEKGNELFRGENHTEACKLYSKALKLCPKTLPVERAMLYNNRAAAKTKFGLKESAVQDCTRAIDLNPPYIKALLRRAKLHEELEQLDRALEDYKELHKLEPNNSEVKVALAVLPKRIEEQTEKLKQEMFGKLKDLGNMVLRPFGLSTDNFQINQDPQTGSYSVNMVNKK